MNELDYDCHLYFQSHVVSEEREAGEGQKGKVSDDIYTHTNTHSDSSSGENDNNVKVDTRAYLEQKIGTGKIDGTSGSSGNSIGSGSGSGGGVEVRATLEVQVTAPCGYTDIISW